MPSTEWQRLVISCLPWESYLSVPSSDIWQGQWWGGSWFEWRIIYNISFSALDSGYWNWCWSWFHMDFKKYDTALDLFMKIASWPVSQSVLKIYHFMSDTQQNILLSFHMENWITFSYRIRLVSTIRNTFSRNNEGPVFGQLPFGKSTMFYFLSHSGHMPEVSIGMICRETSILGIREGF